MELVLLIVIFGLIFDYTNGFHDAANVVSTVIATRALTPLVAILIAGVLNFIGAVQISGVAQTIASGLVDSRDTTQIVVLSAVIGAIFWNLFTWYFGIPSSSSYALIGGLLGASWINKGMQTILWHGLTWKVLVPMALSPLCGFSLSWVFMKGLLRYVEKKDSRKEKKIFRYLQIASACFVALSHGLNDAQKSMGIITLGLFAGGVLTTPDIPFWVILACAATMGLGTASGGFRIIQTMGFSITKIDPIQGFAAETSSATVILSASLFGIPLSTTHVIAGGITGVGSAKGASTVDWRILQRLVLSWLLTLPGAGLVGTFAYIALRYLIN